MKSEEYLFWATQALAGCDGGNLDSGKIWLCGIEPGYQRKKKDPDYFQNALKYYSHGLPLEIKNAVLAKSCIQSLDIDYRFNQQFAKLCAEVKDVGLENYINHVNEISKDIFKLNLFPVAFNNDSDQLWRNFLLENTFKGHDTKPDYRQWCRDNRFPYFAQLTKEKKPKVILCTGTGYYEDFILAFSGLPLVKKKLFQGTVQDKSSLQNGSERSYYYYQFDETHLFVVPFLTSRYGLNSHKLLKQMGAIIRDKVYPSSPHQSEAA